MTSLLALAIIGSTQIGPNTLQVDYLTQDANVLTVIQSTERYQDETQE